MDKPLYQVMRSLTDGEMDELRQSIIDNGVLTPLAFDEEGHILDGHHRMEIIEELGITEYPRTVHTGLTEAEKLRFARDVNVARRHLNNDEKKQETVKRLIKSPELSDRQIAKQVGASNTFVSTLRKELETSGELSTVDSSIGADGKKRVRPVFAYNERQMRSALTKGVPERMEADDSKSPIIAKRKLNKEAKAARKGASYVLDYETDVVLRVDDIKTGLPWIEDNSIDVIITDAPYEKYALTPDENMTTLYSSLSALAARVLREGGIMLCMTGNYYLNRVMYELDAHMQYMWTLCLTTPGASSRTYKRPINQNWKPILVYVKGEYKTEDAYPDVYHSPPFNTEDKQLHPHGQSVEVFTELIERWTDPGMTVLDPFCGGGTTALCCVQSGRRIFTCDINPEHIETTRQRIEEAFIIHTSIIKNTKITT